MSGCHLDGFSFFFIFFFFNSLRLRSCGSWPKIWKTAACLLFHTFAGAIAGDCHERKPALPIPDSAARSGLRSLNEGT